MSATVVSDHKPNLNEKYFWEFHYDQINWKSSYRMVIERILERGAKEDWDELVRFYTKEKMIYTIQHELAYLTDNTIDKPAPFSI